MDKISRARFAVFTKSDLKKDVKYLLKTFCFNLGNWIFRQIIEILMRMDLAPFLANIFEHYYEIRWIRELRKSNIRRFGRFASILWFIDGFTTSND